MYILQQGRVWSTSRSSIRESGRDQKSVGSAFLVKNPQPAHSWNVEEYRDYAHAQAESVLQNIPRGDSNIKWYPSEFASCQSYPVSSRTSKITHRNLDQWCIYIYVCASEGTSWWHWVSRAYMSRSWAESVVYVIVLGLRLNMEGPSQIQRSETWGLSSDSFDHIRLALQHCWLVLFDGHLYASQGRRDP
jgi:hypothetical protein